MPGSRGSGRPAKSRTPIAPRSSASPRSFPWARADSPQQAVVRFLEPIRRALRCITDAQVAVGGSYVLNGEVSLVVNYARPVRLAGTGLQLKVEQTCRIIEADEGGYRLTTTLYAYTLLEAVDPPRPILAYHWHPQQKPRHPHLHIYAAQHAAVPRLPRAHLPTARVALEDVLYLTLDEFGATAVQPNWRGTLKETRDRFVRHRSWGTWPRPRSD